MDPTPQILWPYRYSFLGIALVTFAILSAAVLLTPQRYTVTSSIEVASAIRNGRLEPIEPPADVAKEITDIYLPSASSALAAAGASSSALAAAQNLRVEAVGRSIAMRGTANPKFADTYKELQRAIIDQMAKDKAPLLQTIRDTLNIKLDSARSTSSELQKQIAAITAELANTATRSGELDHNRQQRQAELAAIRQRSVSGSGDRGNVEADIRELRDQISRTETMRTDIAVLRAGYFRSIAELRTRDQEQRRIIADTEHEEKALSDARVLHAPSVMPIPDRSRKAYLLAAALAVSILFAFGIVVLFHRLRKLQT
jgi:hypothetical protein